MKEYCVDVSKVMKKWENREILSKYEKMILLSMINEAKQIKYIISDEKEMINTEEKIKMMVKDKMLLEKIEKELIEGYLKD